MYRTPIEYFRAERSGVSKMNIDMCVTPAAHELKSLLSFINYHPHKYYNSSTFRSPYKTCGYLIETIHTMFCAHLRLMCRFFLASQSKSELIKKFRYVCRGLVILCNFVLKYTTSDSSARQGILYSGVFCSPDRGGFSEGEAIKVAKLMLGTL